MTKAREAALAALREATEPLSAQGMAVALDQCCDQATIYRTLHWLEARGLAESFALHCDEHGTERYYVAAGDSHHHWFHCETCHRFLDLGPCRIHELEAALEEQSGVVVKRHILYFTGLCPSCVRMQTENASTAAPRATTP